MPSRKLQLSPISGSGLKSGYREEDRSPCSGTGKFRLPDQYPLAYSLRSRPLSNPGAWTGATGNSHTEDNLV